MYEAGNYMVRVVSQQLGKTGTGKPQFILMFEVMNRLDPSRPDELLSCDKAERTIYRTIAPKTVEWILDEVKHLCDLGGIDSALPGWEYLDPDTQYFMDLTGIEFEAYCRHETYKDREHEKWGISQGSGAQAEPLDDKSIRNLNALYGKQLKAFGGKAKPKADTKPVTGPDLPAIPETVPPGEPSIEVKPDDDIPF